MSPGRIFISYRRIDSAYASRLLCDRLNEHFGDENVFMDVEDLAPGVDFVDVLDEAVRSCDVAIVIIGPQWLTVTGQDGNRRLDNPDDFVRIEVGTALKRDIRVVPVLVQGARMPGPQELPPDLAHLAHLNAIEIRHERFDDDVNDLIAAIEAYLRQDHQHSPTAWSKSPESGLGFDDLLRRKWTWVLGGGIALLLILLVFWGAASRSVSQRVTPTALPTDTPTATLFVYVAVASPVPVDTNTATPRPTATPTPTPIPTHTGTATPLPSSPTPSGLAGQILDDHGVAMILIPASSFEMGSELGNPDEQPVHTVQLDDFYIDQYLVTNARYQECVNAGVCVPPLDYSSATHENYYENPDYADYPVLYVTWEDAQSYCQWRDAHLPTEAEWEKAARGGLRGALYPWGNQSLTCERANFRAGSYCIGDTSAVGSYAPNKYGLYDMAGNTWEWVTDWYSPKYTADFVENPQGPETGTYRVLRGGSWRDSAEHLRVFNRSNSKPHMRYDDTGFRCARTP